MKLIERYIFRRVLGMTLLTLSVATAIVMTTQLLGQINLVTRSSDAALSFGLIALLFIPKIGLIVMPFALLIAAMRLLAAMNADSELAVLESAGIAPASVGRPVIVLSLILSAASLVVLHSLEPWANRKLNDTVAEASVDLVRAAVQSGSFTKVSDGVFMQIGTELPGGDFGEVVMVDLREKDSQLVYYAKRGSLIEHGDNRLFLLADGEVHRKNLLGGNPSIISFASTAIDFSSFFNSVGGRGMSAEEQPTARLLWPPADDQAAQNRPAEVRQEIHRRFSEWLYPLVFGVIAVYFAGNAGSVRQERPAQIAIGAVVALAVRALGFFTVNNAGSSTLFVVLAYAVPLAVIVVFLSLILGDRKLPLPRARQTTTVGPGGAAILRGGPSASLLRLFGGKPR